MISKILKVGSILFICLAVGGCSQKQLDKNELDQFSLDQLNIWNKSLTDVMVKDIFSPPVASRIYTYSNLAAYEVLALHDKNLTSLSGKIRHLKEIPKPESQPIYPAISSIIAFSEVAQELVYSYDFMAKTREDYITQLKSKGIDQKLLDNSVRYGKQVAEFIINWASGDGYKSRNNNSQIIRDVGEGTWQPTPPDFLEPIEPNWNTIRTFLIDSASQFTPGDPTSFAVDKESQFYKECYDVYEAVLNASDEQVQMAQFWDCNPNASIHRGHVMGFAQKISPGAHWILIASTAMKTAKTSTLEERSKIFTHVSLALADAFISCWSEKYRTVVIRPETYINRYIDKNWKPILQTPAFPEYTSGHSVASGASAAILTKLMGDNFAFVDSTEIEFGLPVRNFASFNKAADEAAISRLYGGIHYMPAITNGVRQGRQIGGFIADKLEVN